MFPQRIRLLIANFTFVGINTLSSLLPH